MGESLLTLLAGERKEKETARAIQACNDYLRLGPARSLRRLLDGYIEGHENTAPTASFDTLLRWSSRHDWVSRALTYDAALEAQKTERASDIMRSGLALEHERVEKLQRLADFLEVQLYEQDEEGSYFNLWLPDVKSIGSGQYAERVDIVRFNQAIVSEYRATLDDLAKETGGRVRKNEIAGKDGGPIQTEVIDSLTSEERAERIAALLEIAERRKANSHDGE